MISRNGQSAYHVCRRFAERAAGNLASPYGTDEGMVVAHPGMRWGGVVVGRQGKRHCPGGVGMDMPDDDVGHGDLAVPSTIAPADRPAVLAWEKGAVQISGCLIREASR